MPTAAVTKGPPPSWSVNGNQKRPTAGATLHTGSLVLGGPRAAATLLSTVSFHGRASRTTTHLASHTTVPCLTVRKHPGSTVDLIHSLCWPGSPGSLPCNLVTAALMSIREGRNNPRLLYKCFRSTA